MSQIRDTIASMPSVACRKTGTGLLEPARPHTVRQRAGTRIGTSGRALTGGHTGSLPGCDTGLVLRLAETGRQLRLKAASFADFAAWLVALHAVPGMREAEFTSLSLELQAAAATANDERDASRSRALAQGLAGLSGAMRDAVQPVASAAAEMAEAQHELRQSLASLHEHYSALTAEMAMARHVALQERNAFLQVLRAGGSGHAPSGHAIHAHSQPAREPRGGQHQDASAAQPLQPSGLFPSKTRQQPGGTCAEDGAPSRRARVPPPAEEEPKALVEGDEECEAQGETRLSNFAPLGALDQGRSGLRGIAGDVSPGRLRSCIAAVQAQFAYSKTHMPTMAHMRQAGFAAEALSVTYAFGGRAALAARLGLEVVPEDVGCSRFGEWGVVEKAVLRAAKALAVQEQRQLIARRQVGGKNRHTRATRPDAPTGDGVCEPAVAPGDARQAASMQRPLCMPSGTELRAQGMEQVPPSPPLSSTRPPLSCD